MLKIKSVPLRRKTFGGQSGIGIWWRKRSAPTSVATEEGQKFNKEKRNREQSDSSTSASDLEDLRPTEKEDAVPSTETSSTSLFLATEETASIGWDDELCRPIYYRHRGTAFDSGNSDAVEDTETDTTNDAVDEDIFVRSDVSEEENGDSDPSVVTNDDSTACPTTMTDENKNNRPFRIPVLSRKRSKTFGNRAKRRRPLSLILTQEDETLISNRGCRRISLEPSPTDAVEAEGEVEEVSDEGSSNSENRDPESNNYGIPVAFQSNSDNKYKRRRSEPKFDPNNSLEKARKYFENLDQTQTLTLDTNLPPPVSSKVTRTRRKTNLDSPGINREYQAYAKSIASDGNFGIPPLSIRDYASSRKLHFQNKGEIVDGFLDD